MAFGERKFRASALDLRVPPTRFTTFAKRAHNARFVVPCCAIGARRRQPIALVRSGPTYRAIRRHGSAATLATDREAFARLFSFVR
jgi:hypothetical protein